MTYVLVMQSTRSAAPFAEEVLCVAVTRTTKRPAEEGLDGRRRLSFLAVDSRVQGRLFASVLAGQYTALGHEAKRRLLVLVNGAIGTGQYLLSGNKREEGTAAVMNELSVDFFHWIQDSNVNVCGPLHVNWLVGIEKGRRQILKLCRASVHCQRHMVILVTVEPKLIHVLKE